MEDALVQISDFEGVQFEHVLILVLMEDALVQVLRVVFCRE